MVTKRECELCKAGIDTTITMIDNKMVAEIKALRRELALTASVTITLISIVIAIKLW